MPGAEVCGRERRGGKGFVALPLYAFGLLPTAEERLIALVLLAVAALRLGSVCAEPKAGALMWVR